MATARTERLFLFPIALVLASAGLAKLLSSLLELPVQSLPDPVFQFSERSMWRLGALVDFGLLGALIVFWKHRGWVVAWGGAVFLAYHASSLILGGDPVCPCLGRASAWLNVSDVALQRFALAFSTYMVLVGIQVTRSIPGRTTDPVKTMECPSTQVSSASS